MKEYLIKKIGQPIAILCARYWYRGIIGEVKKDVVILTNAFAIEETGAPTAERTSREDSIPSDLLISFGAIEIVMQPTWAMNQKL